MTGAMQRALGALIAVGALLGASRAEAQVMTGGNVYAPGDLSWTATAARTVGAGASVLQGEAGWPGISFTYLKGLDERTDAGLRLAFNYGFEGTTTGVAGLVLSVPVRRFLGGTDSFNYGIHVDPGLAIYGNSGSTLFGVTLPVGAVAGIPITPQLTVDVTADFPVLISFVNPLGVLFGPEIGAGAEYKVDRNLAVSLRTRIGPEFALANGVSGTQTAFQTLGGVAYNMR